MLYCPIFILHGTSVMAIIFSSIVLRIQDFVIIFSELVLRTHLNNQAPTPIHPDSGESTLPPPLHQPPSILGPGYISPRTATMEWTEQLYPVPKVSSSKLLHI